MDGDLAAAAPRRRVETTGDVRRVFVDGLRLKALIGVYDHERAAPQDIVIDVEVTAAATDSREDIDRVVCYDWICEGVRGIVEAGHINLVETLADRIADHCLSAPLARAVRVRIAKPGAIADAAAAGVEIERARRV